jgi:tetratricopeptide (TPR) repeat protein
LCNYRPTFSLFKVCQTSKFGNAYHEIRLENLPISIAQNMIKSLIKTDCIPGELEHWVNSKAEGNPFYIEELVNALIETETLIQENGSWKLSRSLTESNIPSSLHGLISSRIDRLEIQSKHALKEASEIGRVFLYKILKSITGIEQQRIDVELNNLERNDLTRMRSLHPDITYMFKHALTHEIVYNSLLKKKRREIHEHIARVIERIFTDRQVEFYETLAFHFARGQSVTKAIDYLVKSGEKSLARYAVEEAHLYFNQAYNILSAKEELSESEKRIFIDMLNSWSYAYYYSGQIKDWINLLKSHQSLAESLEEESRLGMFYAWIGCALITGCKPKKAYDYLLRSIEIGECTGDQKVIGYACTWLSWACGWQGLFDEGITYGLRAQQISESFPSDQYLYFKSLSAICYIYYAQGKTKELFEGTKRLLIYGDKTANSRSKVFGYWLNALGHLAKGEVELAQKESKKSIQAAADPFYSYFAQSSYGMSYLLEGKIKQAEDTFILLSDHCEKSGIELMSQFAKMFLSFIYFANGNMNLGFRMIKDVQKALKENNMKVWYAISESMLNVLYTKFITGPSADFVSIIKNLSSVAKNAPFADKKAEKKFLNAIEMFREMGAKVNLGQALLGLGRLHKAKKRNKDARKCFREAINIFQESNALLFLTQAREDLSLIE